MKTYQAEILIGGEMKNTVVKNGLTAAEILVLRAIHGDDALVAIKPQEEIKQEYQVEYDRLIKTYGAKRVKTVFPGARPVLPQNLADVGILVTEDGFLTTEIIAKGPNNPNFQSKREKEFDDQLEDPKQKKASIEDFEVDEDEAFDSTKKVKKKG